MINVLLKPRSVVIGTGKVDDNIVTTITDAKAGTLGTARTYEMAFSVKHATINPQTPLRQYRMLLIQL